MIFGCSGGTNSKATMTAVGGPLGYWQYYQLMRPSRLSAVRMGQLCHHMMLSSDITESVILTFNLSLVRISRLSVVRMGQVCQADLP